METAYQNAIRRRDELQQELEQVETFLRLYKKYVSLSGSSHATSTLKAGLTVTQADNHAPDAERPLEHVAGIELVPHIRTAILDIGRPQSRKGVVRALSDRGILVGGKNPVTNVGTIMWRAKDEFVNLKPHGYWPKDMAYPPAGYHPEQDHDAESNDGRNHEENGSATAAKENYDADLWRAVDTP